MPLEWIKHLEGLTPEDRRAFAASVCRKVVDRTALQGEVVERAITAITSGQGDSDLAGQLQAVVAHYDAEYDSLVGEDESNLLCTDPEIRTAFLNSTAATVLRYALEGDLAGMAYYGWCVLDDLNEIRRLAGMPDTAGEAP